MSTLWGSYASRCTGGLNEKKPYNPILGEQFHCTLGDVKCICEQGGQKSKFKGTTIKIEQVGRATLSVKPWDEVYMIDFPDLLIRGVLTGAAYIELGGVCTISSTNGAKAVIEFVPKPWFGGEYNHIKGTISVDEKEYCTLSGRWSHQSYYVKSGESNKQLLFDAEAEPMADRVTPPTETQQEIESHRLWGKVTEALNVKNYGVATAEKTKIEDWQRKLRKERADNNETWSPVLFTFEKDDAPANDYAKRSVAMKEDMVGKPFLDEGAWTYKNSLHLRDQQ
ncbi:Oxysterol binding protein [Apophysomyces sp. BC1021]|nr:Oxysterol binding protein [Apophysomyces sp. BC1021]